MGRVHAGAIFGVGESVDGKDDGRIMRARKDGTGTPLVLVPSGKPFELTVNAKHVYDTSDGALMRVPK